MVETKPVEKKVESKLPKLPSKTEMQMEQMLNMMSNLVQSNEALAQRIEAIENKTVAPTVTTATLVQEVKPFDPKLEDETYPSTYVPAKWRTMIDEILGKEFGFTVNDFEDRTDFQINIFVPAEYSSLRKEEREAGVQDVRSKIITRAMGENGVREWAQKVRFNLNKYYMKEGKASPFK